MKTIILYLIIFLSMLSSCNSQEIKNKKHVNEKKKPQEKVTVNRKYDENGNLIEFDSTYTSYYSNINGDTLNLESIMKDFPVFFNDEFFNLNSMDFFNPFFTEDSTLDSQFFHDDYFEEQFFNQNKNMLKMIQRMDSIKNSFFERQRKNE